MLLKAEVTCYVKKEIDGIGKNCEEIYHYSQKIDCAQCLHDSIICGWTVQTKKGPRNDSDFDIYNNILFIRPGDHFIEVITRKAVKEPFKIFFNLYAPNELKNADGSSADVPSGV
jgi:hypothetical protein